MTSTNTEDAKRKSMEPPDDGWENERAAKRFRMLFPDDKFDEHLHYVVFRMLAAGDVDEVEEGMERLSSELSDGKGQVLCSTIWKCGVHVQVLAALKKHRQRANLQMNAMNIIRQLCSSCKERRAYFAYQDSVELVLKAMERFPDNQRVAEEALSLLEELLKAFPHDTRLADITQMDIIAISVQTFRKNYKDLSDTAKAAGFDLLKNMTRFRQTWRASFENVQTISFLASIMERSTTFDEPFWNNLEDALQAIVTLDTCGGYQVSTYDPDTGTSTILHTSKNFQGN